MSTIGVAQLSCRVVVVGKEKRRVGTVAGVVVEDAVYRSEQYLRPIEGQGRLASQAGLQIRHQQSGGDPLAGDIADDQRQPLRPEIQKVEIIPPNLPCLQAHTCILDGFQLRLNLGKQPGLDLLRYFKFLGCAAFGFEFFSVYLPSQLQAPLDLIKAFQSKHIPVWIFEACKGPAPQWLFWRG